MQFAPTQAVPRPQPPGSVSEKHRIGAAVEGPGASGVGSGLAGSRGLFVGLAALLLVALMGIVAWLEISSELGSGPSAFVLASGSTQADRINYTYRTFNGLVRQETELREGQTLELAYAADVQKGSLSMEVKDPTGKDVWRLNVPEHEKRQGAANVRPGQSGSYQVVVTGLDTGGSFDISWEAE